jgi:hypothetical protein
MGKIDIVKNACIVICDDVPCIIELPNEIKPFARLVVINGFCDFNDLFVFRN